MEASLLTQLGLSPHDVRRLAGQERTRLLSFLQRWRVTDELHACLDILEEERPDLISLLDLRARAYAAAEHFDEALQIMEKRLSRQASVPAYSLLADIHLARQDRDAAEAIAATLIAQDEESYAGWRIRAEAALQRGDLAAATAANHALGKLRPNGTRYLLNMVALYRAREDWVTASGYAVRLLNTVEALWELPPPILEALRDYFRASGEETRTVELSEALDARYHQEFEELKSLFARQSAPDETSRLGIPPSVQHENVSEWLSLPRRIQRDRADRARQNPSRHRQRCP